MTQRIMENIILQGYGLLVCTYTIITAEGFTITNQRFELMDSDLVAFAQTRQKQTWDELDACAYLDEKQPLVPAGQQAALATVWRGNIAVNG